MEFGASLDCYDTNIIIGFKELESVMHNGQRTEKIINNWKSHNP